MQTVPLATRFKTLRGARLGFLDTGKRGSAAALRAVARELERSHGIEVVETWTKTSPYRLSSEAVIEKIARGCDGLVLGIADCCACSACCMRDLLELELRGLPTAYLATLRRVPTVHPIAVGVALRHGFEESFAERWREKGPQSAELHRSLLKFGVHRALRVAGVKAGDPVELGGRRVRWDYPPDPIEDFKLPGTGRWCSRADGVVGYRTVEIAVDRIYGLPKPSEWVPAAATGVTSILLGRKQRATRHAGSALS
jgi:hypothetical protein